MGRSQRKRTRSRGQRTATKTGDKEMALGWEENEDMLTDREEMTRGEAHAQWGEGLLCKASHAQTLRWAAESSKHLPSSLCNFHVERGTDQRSSPSRALEPNFLRMP